MIMNEMMCEYISIVALSLTERCDDAWPYFQAEVFCTTRRQSLVAHDFQLNREIDVAVPYLLYSITQTKLKLGMNSMMENDFITNFE